MSALYLTIIKAVLQSMPQVAQEVEAAIKEAESPDAASAKVKGLLTDAAHFIETVAGAL